MWHFLFISCLIVCVCALLYIPLEKKACYINVSCIDRGIIYSEYNGDYMGYSFIRSINSLSVRSSYVRLTSSLIGENEPLSLYAISIAFLRASLSTSLIKMIV